MQSSQFITWLMGFHKINNKAPTEKQWQIIVDHLELAAKSNQPPESGPTTIANSIPTLPTAITRANSSGLNLPFSIDGEKIPPNMEQYTFQTC